MRSFPEALVLFFSSLALPETESCQTNLNLVNEPDTTLHPNETTSSSGISGELNRGVIPFSQAYWLGK